MAETDTLLHFPYVLVRVRCTDCKRSGSYRLVRLAARFGESITLEDLLRKLADCPHERPRYPGKPGCFAYFVDLNANPPRPPDLPVMGLTVIEGGKTKAVKAK